MGVLNKRKSTCPSVIRSTQNFDASVDGNLANDGDSTSIFIKVIGCELFQSTSADMYLRCRMDFTSDTVGTEASNFVDFGIPAVNTSDEFNTFGTTATRVRRPTDGPHYSALNHVFGKAAAVVMSATRSEQNYIYKTDF